jgi:NAD-dependent deacetylase
VDSLMSDALARAADAIRRAPSVVALTGAGISAESGVPTFRGPDGLWKQYRAEDLATPQAFERDPATVWEWYAWRRGRIAIVRPNPGHEVLARLEDRLPAFALITQNVDGLHQRAGSRRVLELHGSIWRSICARGCGFSRDDSGGTGSLPDHAELRDERSGGVLPMCTCGGLLRPGVVWFGEALNPAVIDAAVQAAESATVCLVIGTSSLVYPAAGLPSLAKRAGSIVVEVNLEPTPLTPLADIVLRGPAGVVLPALEARL